MSTWTISINGAAAVSPESLGATLLGGSFRSHGAGFFEIEIAADFDASHPFSFDTPVTLLRDGTAWFKGRCKTVPRYGSAAEEGIVIRVEDAWSDMEETVYQEERNALIPAGEALPYAVGAIMLSKSLEGKWVDGTDLTTASMITAVLTFAAANGVSIQAGTIPTGTKVFPTEYNGLTCSEAILRCMNRHHDWITSLDHTTTPPTLNIYDSTTATARSYAVDGSGVVKDFEITRRDDRKPKRVIVNFVSNKSGTIADIPAALKAITPDIYPPPPVSGVDPLPMAGPRVISATLDLASTEAVPPTSTAPIVDTIKARVQVRALPTSNSNVKDWLVLKYPHLAAVDPSHFTASDFAATLVASSETPPPRVNPESYPAAPSGVSDVPNELVAGTIEDWMNKKTGKVKISCKITPAAGATADEIKAIKKPLPPCVVVATNATTSLYQKVTNYTPGSTVDGNPATEAAPLLGMAQQYYTALQQNTYEGRVIIEGDEIEANRLHGCVLNLTGGLSEWTTMKALVNEVAWDLQAGRTSIAFGPPRWVSFGDFIALQDSLRAGLASWTDAANRDAEGAAYDTAPTEFDNIQGFTSPETTFEQPEIKTGSLAPFTGVLSGAAAVKFPFGTLLGSVSAGTYLTPTGMTTETALSATTKIWMQVTISSLSATAAAITAGTAWPAAATFTGTPPSEAQTQATCKLGEVASGALPDNTPGFEFSITGTTYHFKQYCNTNLAMAAVVFDGKAALLPLPWPG